MLRGVACACGASLKRVANVARTAMVSSSPSHGENRGSSPLGAPNEIKYLIKKACRGPKWVQYCYCKKTQHRRPTHSRKFRREARRRQGPLARIRCLVSSLAAAARSAVKSMLTSSLPFAARMVFKVMPGFVRGHFALGGLLDPRVDFAAERPEIDGLGKKRFSTALQCFALGLRIAIGRDHNDRHIGSSRLGFG
jgi:hypothetical protein